MRILDYMVREGAKNTLKRVWERISAGWGGVSARTTFLSAERIDTGNKIPPGIKIERMGHEDVQAFDAFNFFPHIKGNEYLGRDGRGAVLCREDGCIVGYVCYEVSGLKNIHGMGYFQMKENEAWIGPCYVNRFYRGKGINGAMVYRAMKEASAEGAECFFTAINSSNVASLASFKRWDSFRLLNTMQAVKNSRFTTRFPELTRFQRYELKGFACDLDHESIQQFANFVAKRCMQCHGGVDKRYSFW